MIKNLLDKANRQTDPLLEAARLVSVRTGDLRARPKSAIFCGEHSQQTRARALNGPIIIKAENQGAGATCSRVSRPERHVHA